MRIVLGVDDKGCWEAARRLLTRLRFKDGVVDAVHVVETPTFYIGPGSEMMPSIDAAELAEVCEQEGRRLSARAAAALRAGGVATGLEAVMHGSAPDRLLHYADDMDTGLIAVGSSGKGPVHAFFTGSVGRGLVIGAHQSILVAKGQPAPEGPVRAVLATDHSRYADRCVRRLLEMAPQGIERLTVLTAYPKEFVRSVRAFLPEFVLDPADWIERNLRERNARLLETLAPLGCALVSRVVDELPAEAIGGAMREENADLLILGAQGHGFVERLTLGSTSFHQVVAEPHPVLVLRVPPAPEDTSDDRQ